MTSKELLKQTPAELSVLLAEQRARVRELSFQVGVGRLKHVRALRDAKRTIARILTSLRASQLTHSS